MTANQVYKKSKVETPFNEWVSEQTKNYGKDFIKSEAFINHAGDHTFREDYKSPEQIVKENIDENIDYGTGVNLGADFSREGASVGGDVSVGGASIGADVRASKGNLKWLYILGGLTVVYLVYNKYVK